MRKNIFHTLAASVMLAAMAGIISCAEVDTPVMPDGPNIGAELDTVIVTPQEANPKFIEDWEHQYTLNLFTTGSPHVSSSVTHPWAPGATTSLPDAIRFDVKKEDGWEGNPDAALYHCDGNGDELRQIHYSKSTLAFSPSVILNGFINFHWKGLQAVWHTNFVSRQYLDNTENSDRSLPCYSVSNINLSYSLKPKKVLKEAVFGLNFSNVFNRRYAASGWVYSAVAESYGHTPDNRYYQIGFIPMAGFTMMGNVTLRF